MVVMTAKLSWCLSLVEIAAVIALSTCTSTAPKAISVTQYVDKAIAGLDEGYFAGSPEWNRAVSKALPELYSAETIAETYPLLRQLTKVAGGSHSSFATPSESAAKDVPYPTGHVPVPTVEFDDPIATIVIPAFSSKHQYEINQYLESAAKIFSSPRAQSACGWVIDVAGNIGGDPRVMLVALTPLLDDGVVVRIRDRGGARTSATVLENRVVWEKEDWGVLPTDPVKLPDKPIGIVQGPATASAGEWVVVAFKGQTGVKTFGSETGGFTTVNNGIVLPDGATVTLSYALMGDRRSVYYEAPIPPDMSDTSDNEAPRTMAKEWVANQCPVLSESKVK